MREINKLQNDVQIAFKDHNYAKEKDDKQRRTIRSNVSADPNLQKLYNLFAQKQALDLQIAEANRQALFKQVQQRVTFATIIEDVERITNQLNNFDVSIPDLEKKFLPDGPLPPLKSKDNDISGGVARRKTAKKPSRKNDS